MASAAALSLSMMTLFDQLNGPSWIWSIGYALIIGIWEGIILGGIQSVILTQLIPNLSIKKWVQWTVVATTLCWVLGIIPSTIAQYLIVESVAHTGPSPIILILLGTIMGIFLGAILGWFQTKELAHHTPKSRLWIGGNIIGWAFAMAIIMGSTTLPTASTSVHLIGITAGLSGLAGGLAAGMITGVFAIKLFQFTHTLSGR